MTLARSPNPRNTEARLLYHAIGVREGGGHVAPYRGSTVPQRVRIKQPEPRGEVEHLPGLRFRV